LLARLCEKPAAKADALIFGTQIQLVDFTLLGQLSGAVPAYRGVAGENTADFHDKDARRACYRVRPPARPPAVDHLRERAMRNDAAVSATPCLQMHIGNSCRVLRTCLPDVDRERI